MALPQPPPRSAAAPLPAQPGPAREVAGPAREAAPPRAVYTDSARHRPPLPPAGADPAGSGMAPAPPPRPARNRKCSCGGRRVGGAAGATPAPPPRGHPTHAGGLPRAETAPRPLRKGSCRLSAPVRRGGSRNRSRALTAPVRPEAASVARPGREQEAAAPPGQSRAGAGPGRGRPAREGRGRSARPALPGPAHPRRRRARGGAAGMRGRSAPARGAGGPGARSWRSVPSSFPAPGRRVPSREEAVLRTQEARLRGRTHQSGAAPPLCRNRCLRPARRSDAAGAVLSRQRFCRRAQENELPRVPGQLRSLRRAEPIPGSAEMPGPGSTPPQPPHRAHGFETSQIRKAVFVVPWRYEMHPQTLLTKQVDIETVLV